MQYNMKECGRRIQTLRARNGYTQEQFAKVLNIDRSNLSRIETGVRSCSLELLVQLSELFEVSLDYLILGRDHKNDSIDVVSRNQMKDDLDILIKQAKQIRSNL